MSKAEETGGHWDDPNWAVDRMERTILLVETARAAVNLIPESRERSVALERLDEAAMWLIRAETKHLNSLVGQ